MPSARARGRVGGKSGKKVGGAVAKAAAARFMPESAEDGFPLLDRVCVR
jgi:hypothetical protein